MENKKMRCHFSIIFESMWQFWAVIVIIALNQIGNIQDLITTIKNSEAGDVDGIIGGLTGLAAIVVVSGGVLLIQFLRWRKTWITLSDNLIIVERNTINRKKNTIAVENISAVNMEQNLFERIVGTCKIKIDTNSLTTANTTDVAIVFGRRDAESFREAVMEKIKALKEDGQRGQTGTESGGREADSFPEREEAGNFLSHERGNMAGEYGIGSDSVVQVYSYSTKELLSHWWYSVPVYSLIFVLGAIAAFFWGWAVFGLEEVLSFFADGALATVVLVISAAYDIIKQFIMYYNLKVYRMGKDIHLSYGLIKKESYILPVDKIACIKISQPFIARVCRKYFAEVHTVGFAGKSGGMANITLAMDKDIMLERLKVLAPEYAQANILEDITRQEKSVKFISLAGWSLWIIAFVLCGTAAVILLEAPVYIAVIAVSCIAGFAGLLYILGYKTKGYKLCENEGVFVSGHFGRKYSVVKYGNIQYIDFESEPLSAKFALRSAKIFLLNKRVAMPYAPLPVCESLGKRMLGR